MKLGTRATLVKSARKTVDVDFYEEDVSYRLREMMGSERDSFEIAAFKVDESGNRVVDPKNLRARLVALCLIGEDGARLYRDDEIEVLNGEVPAGIIGKLFTAAQKLNGLEATAVEDAEKNSSSGPPVASTSA